MNSVDDLCAKNNFHSTNLTFLALMVRNICICSRQIVRSSIEMVFKCQEDSFLKKVIFVNEVWKKLASIIYILLFDVVCLEGCIVRKS